MYPTTLQMHDAPRLTQALFSCSSGIPCLSHAPGDGANGRSDTSHVTFTKSTSSFPSPVYVLFFTQQGQSYEVHDCIAREYSQVETKQDNFSMTCIETP